MNPSRLLTNSLRSFVHPASRSTGRRFAAPPRRAKPDRGPPLPLRFASREPSRLFVNSLLVEIDAAFAVIVLGLAREEHVVVWHGAVALARLRVVDQLAAVVADDDL